MPRKHPFASYGFSAFWVGAFLTCSVFLTACNKGSSGGGDSGSSGGVLGQDYIDIKVKFTGPLGSVPTSLAPFDVPLPLTYGFLSTDASYNVERTTTVKNLNTVKFLSSGNRKLNLVARFYLYDTNSRNNRGKLLQEISTKIAYKDMTPYEDLVYKHLDIKETNIGKFILTNKDIDRRLNPKVIIIFSVEDPFLKFLESKGILTSKPIMSYSEDTPKFITTVNDLAEKGLNGKLADYFTFSMFWNNGYRAIAFEPNLVPNLGKQYYSVNKDGNTIREPDQLDPINADPRPLYFGNFKTPRFVIHIIKYTGAIQYPPFVMYSSTFTEADYPEDKAIEYFFANFKFD